MVGIDSLLAGMANDVPSLVIMTVVVIVFLRALRTHTESERCLAARLIAVTDQASAHIASNTEVLRSLSAQISVLQGIRQPAWFVDTLPPKPDSGEQ